MPIVSCAIVPHSPILLPTIGKTVADKFAATTTSFDALSDSMHNLAIETIVLITNPDATKNTDILTIHASDTYAATFEEFGDFVTRADIKCDTVLALSLKKGFDEVSLPCAFASQEKLDYSASVPLLLLKISDVKLIVIQPPEAPYKILMEQGAALQRILQESDKRIVVIASGDLSHSLTENAPLGLKLEGTVVDQDIVALFRSRKIPVKKIWSFSKEAAERNGVCGMNAFATLAGILNRMHCKTRFHSYEGPLGVGYCIISYIF